MRTFPKSPSAGACLPITVRGSKDGPSALSNTIILIALDNEKIIGHLQISIGTSPRSREMGDLFIYLHQDYQNLGLGAALMKAGIELARRRHLRRVELTVVADNDRAIRLYEKVRFQREGMKRENYLGEDGKYHDEVIMGILL